MKALPGLTAVLTAAASTAVCAQPAEMVHISWKVVSASDDLSDLRMNHGEPVEALKISPVGAVRLKHDIVVNGSPLILSGAILAPSTLSEKVLCEAYRGRKRDFFRCIEDTDGDGKFDKHFSLFAREHYYGYIISREYALGALKSYDRRSLSQPIPIPTLEPAGDAVVSASFEILYFGKSNFEFQVCLQDPGRKKFCPSTVKISTKELPSTATLMQTQLAVTGREKNTAIVTLTPPPAGLILD